MGGVPAPAYCHSVDQCDQAVEGLCQQQEGLQFGQADHEGLESNAEEDATVSEGVECVCAPPQLGRGLCQDVQCQDQAVVRGRAELGDGGWLGWREDQGPHEEYCAAFAGQWDQDRGQAATDYVVSAAQEWHYWGQLAEAPAPRHDSRRQEADHS